MTLRTRLALAFALFAAVPLGATFWPVSRALSRSLEAEHGARLDAAARAIEGEIARLVGRSALAVEELARSDEALALARDHASGALAIRGSRPCRQVARGARPDVLSAVEPTDASFPPATCRAGPVTSTPTSSRFSRRLRRAALCRASSPAPGRRVERVLALVAWRRSPARRSAPGRGRGGARQGAGGAARGPHWRLRLGRRGRRRVAGRGGGARCGVRREMAVAARDPRRARRTGPPDLPGPRSRRWLASRSPRRRRARQARATVLLAFAQRSPARRCGRRGRERLASRITRPVEALRDAASLVAAGTSVRASRPVPRRGRRACTSVQRHDG
jgi:hypothetical protein